MPSSQGSARKAQAPSQRSVGAGREKPLSSPTFQPAAADPERCFQARRRPGNLCGHTTCPQHSALASCSVWTSYAHRVFNNALTHPRALVVL